MIYLDGLLESMITCLNGLTNNQGATQFLFATYPTIYEPQLSPEGRFLSQPLRRATYAPFSIVRGV